MDKAKIKDYATSLAFFGVAAIVAYQGQIMAQIPPEYGILALVGFGILSQIAADARVKAKVAEGQEEIDAAQAELEKQKAKAEAAYAEANAKVDEVQAKVTPEPVELVADGSKVEVVEEDGMA